VRQPCTMYRTIPRALLCALLLTALTARAAALAPMQASFTPDHRTLRISGPGINALRAAFSATVERNGKRMVLSSLDGNTQTPLKKGTQATPYGVAEITTATIQFPDEHATLELDLGQVPSLPGALLQPTLRNTGTEPLHLLALTAIDMPSTASVLNLPRAGNRIYLAKEAATSIQQGWGECQNDHSVARGILSIGGQKFRRGLGTHAVSTITFQLDGAAAAFHAAVGADDEINGTVGFEVYVDGHKAFDSGVMKQGDAAKTVDVPLAGARQLRLIVNDGGNGTTCDHADWADAYVTLSDASSTTSAPASEPLTLEVAGDPADWVVTPLDHSGHSESSPARTLPELQQGLAIHEYGSLYHHDGRGFLLGPVGTPIAYLETRLAYLGQTQANLNVRSEMSGVQVDPGEARAGQQALLLMEPPAKALPRWADWVAQTHHARTSKGALCGWCSWYHLTNRITGKDVLGVTHAALENPARLRPAVVQIDDGYQDIDGQWDANAKFPEGLPFYAQQIARTGARPGLWMAITMIGAKASWLQDPANLEAVWGKRFVKESSFRPDATGWLDPTHPRAQAYIADRIRHAVQGGFTYLKLDFNNIGSGRWYDKKSTSFEIMRQHYTRIRQAAGEDTYILFCTEEPCRATVGLVDATRTSHDAHRGGVRSAVNDVLRSYPLNARWMAVDNDCYYMATDVPHIGNVSGGWPLVQTWISMMGLSCGAAITSDPWQWDSFKPYWRNVEILTPPAHEHTNVLDLGTAKDWPRLIGHVQRPWGTWSVALLWNPLKDPQPVALDFAAAGLDPGATYAVWSFWDSKFLGLAKGSWTTEPLAPNACRHICLTPLPAQSTAPVLIGSNLHIYCGAAEIKSITPAGTGTKLELTDAGARTGDLFFYRTTPLVLKSATGCIAAPVQSAGVNIWSLHIADRQTGKAQCLELQ